MVNADRVKKKIPSLLVDDDTKSKVGWRNFMNKHYKYTQFRKCNPLVANAYINRIANDLKELYLAINGLY